MKTLMTQRRERGERGEKERRERREREQRGEEREEAATEGLKLVGGLVGELEVGKQLDEKTRSTCPCKTEPTLG